MPEKPGWLSGPLFVWTAANFLGVGALVLVLLLMPIFFEIESFTVVALFLASIFSLAQWLALRRFTHISGLWILAMPLGLLVSAWIFRQTPETLFANLGLDDESILVLTLLYLIAGFLIGLAQWLVLRLYFPGASLWLVGSTLGVAAGFPLVLATGLIDQSEILAYLVVLLVYSLITGLALARLVGRRDHALAGVVA